MSEVKAVTSEELDQHDREFIERVQKNLAPSEIDPETGKRADGAEVHPEGCGCVECNFQRYGCETCAGAGGEGCTAEKCALDNDEGDDNE